MRVVAVFVVVAGMIAACFAKDESDFVNQHLNSIGTAEARAAVKNRVLQGKVTFQIVNRGPQVWEGPATLVSEGGDKLANLMKFPPTVYRTEWFVMNGKKTSIAPVKPGGWSEFGDFVKAHNEILTEGLFGGTLTTGWALEHLDERHAKLDDKGIKKVDGVELHRIDYVPKRGSDLSIQLYFEPDTSRHVMTVYLLGVAASLGRNAAASMNEHEERYRLEERFGNFMSVNNINLPARWIIRFSYGIEAEGIIDQYDVTEEKVSQNISVDPKNFEMK